MPFTWLIGLHRRDIQTPIDTGNRAITKEGQWLGPWHFLISGEQSTCIADRQQSSHRPATCLGQYLPFAAALVSNGQPIWHHRKRHTIRQWYQCGGVKR